ncbi:hypothetical protein GGS23DRAFT_59301 [Durotheca rogersii]|uniref:uncharacterized protein n=1 Tax=Durotheca rogersii TaxID=419775 RepID=UPI00221EBE74|nr:uncharacterized protein GGS23DRAFT_59301 [Durotheca rogersii]KAI5863218.1 hypothetical protein GGS23DRAFT_59301 [Durotheca rogersii]
MYVGFPHHTLGAVARSAGVQRSAACTKRESCGRRNIRCKQPETPDVLGGMLESGYPGHGITSSSAREYKQTTVPSPPAPPRSSQLRGGEVSRYLRRRAHLREPGLASSGLKGKGRGDGGRRGSCISALPVPLVLASLLPEPTQSSPARPGGSLAPRLWSRWPAAAPSNAGSASAPQPTRLLGGGDLSALFMRSGAGTPTSLGAVGSPASRRLGRGAAAACR